MTDRRIGFLAAIGVAVLGISVVAPVHPAVAVGGEESHCVVEVIDQQPDGELVLGRMRCYGTFAEAVADVSGGDIRLDADATGAVLFSDAETGALLASFTLGVHFDGFNGSGSSISVVGDSCTGGWWNTGTAWANRISSSRNGCYRLIHHDGPNKTGASESTVGAGVTHNLSSGLNNKAESVSYWSS